ncbi:MAG: hypothetical protein DMF87_11105 [Acidobacteria bacterium]|nr:MAG: hypothetical protein DMF87_11105 [Acidobacteriota bacterium]
MSMKFLVAAALAAGLALTATAASAQSLGALAKQEEARRKTVQTPGKVYTNQDLRSSDGSPAPETGAPAAPAADATLQPGAASLDRSKSFAEAPQSRINALTTDFAARSDPAQRSVIEQDRKKALAELDRVNQEIKDNSKAITGIQDEARKAGVPAGWYR